MLCDKIIEVGLDVSDPIALYAGDGLMSILSLKYEGKCFRACLIKKVVRVIETTDCIINREGAPNFGTMSIRFLARVLVYSEGEIINGCEVVRHDANSSIVCKSTDASIMISDKLFESITEGQKISIRVGVARYNIGASSVSVNGIPFIQEQILTVYKYTPGADSELARGLLAAIDEEKAKMKELRAGPNAKHWDIMEQVIYAYSTQQEKPKDAIEISIDAFIHGPRETRYVSRDPRIGTRDCVYGYAQPPAGAIVNNQLVPSAVMIALLQDYYDYIRTVREFTEIYNTSEMISKHSNLWKIYKKLKAIA